MTTLHFNGQLVRQQPVARMVYTARDTADRLYTIGIDTNGQNGFAAVYDAATLATLYARTCFGHRVHSDELKRTLQAVADGFASDTNTHEESH